MSLQRKAEALRQTIDDLLVAGGDIAVPILIVVNATANWCPPLKMVTGGALSILDEVKVGYDLCLAMNGSSNEVAPRRSSRRTRRNGLILVNT
jgi:hypothetical protein